MCLVMFYVVCFVCEYLLHSACVFSSVLHHKCDLRVLNRVYLAVYYAVFLAACYIVAIC